MAEAQYFHATIYRFAQPAFQEVIQRFKTIVPDVSARCSYDKDLDMFCVESPGEIGHVANSALNEALSSFIEDELAAAEREDRRPTIQSLADEIFGDELSEDDNADFQCGTLGESEIPASSTITHHINSEDSDARIKLFKLNDLHGALVDRVLSPNDRSVTKAIKQGVTARVVSWDARSEAYVFNGRYGNPVGVSTSSLNAALFHSSQFDTLSDLRSATASDTHEEVTPARTWKFKNDENIDIHRFLAGMGETEFVDPDTVPEKPDDAAKFLAHSTIPQLPTGRPRVPKVIASGSSDGESDSDSDDDGQESKAPMDTNLIFGVPGYSTADGNRTPSIPTNEQRMPTLDMSAVLGMPDNAAQKDNTSTTPSIDERQSESIPAYDRKYAQVDRIGLGGIASNQAAWELENPVPPRKTNKSGITRRTAPTVTASHASLPLASPSIAGQNSIPGAQNWENKVVRPVATGNLIDDSSGRNVEKDHFAGLFERLQKMPSKADEKKYTMRQQARKPKAKKKGQAPMKAVLPVPDPAPVIQDSSVAPVRSPSPASSVSRDDEDVSANEAQLLTTAIERLLCKTACTEHSRLRIDFGMTLLSEGFPKGALSKETLQSKLEAGSHDTTFLTRLTTSAADALFLLSDDLIPGSPVTAKRQYEFVIKNAEGSQSIITMDHGDRSNIRVTSRDMIGTMFMHFPIRIWDARVTIENEALECPPQAAIDFVSSMQTVDEPPSFVARMPTAAFAIEKVYAKRSFSKEIWSGLQLVVTEVQHLMLSAVDDTQYNVKVTASSEQQMVENQRLWWECALHSELDFESAAGLQGVVDRIVTRIDGVGCENKGPWTKSPVDGGEVVQQWFW